MMTNLKMVPLLVDRSAIDLKHELGRNLMDSLIGDVRGLPPGNHYFQALANSDKVVIANFPNDDRNEMYRQIECEPA